MNSESSSNGPLTFEKPAEGTKGNQLALEPSQFVQILEGCADAVVVSDHQGFILFFNESAERIFQYRREEVLGQNVRLLMPDIHAYQHDQYLQNYLRTGEAKIIGKGRELDARRKDGTPYPILLTISESRDAQRRIFAAFIKDNREKEKWNTKSGSNWNR
ncbi:MAG: PAS domain S-box protein [Microscillaceae bacterium]|nr:PAS domain S-box protein [Microscillaceae bacterium]